MKLIAIIMSIFAFFPFSAGGASEAGENASAGDVRITAFYMTETGDAMYPHYILCEKKSGVYMKKRGRILFF